MYSKLRQKGIPHEKAHRLAVNYSKLEFLKMKFPIGTRETFSEEFEVLWTRGAPNAKMARAQRQYIMPTLRRMIIENATRNPRAQHQLLDIIVHGMIDRQEKTRIDKYISGHHTETDRTIENFLKKYYPHFDEKPESVKARLIQESRSQLRGIIGAERIVRGMVISIERSRQQYKKLLPKLIRTQQLEAERGILGGKPSFLFPTRESVDEALSVLENVLANSKNIIYLQREIVHAWGKSE